MARMSKFTLLARPAGRCKGGPPGGWVGKAGREQRLVAVRGPGGEGPGEAKEAVPVLWSSASKSYKIGAVASGNLPLLRWELAILEPVLPASAITRRAPKCAPDMYVWSSADLRLIYA